MPTLGRPREFDREAALIAAMNAFWAKGYAATSMADLCEAMGIRSPSLYAAFGSKEALYLEAQEHYAKLAATLIWDHLATGSSARASIHNTLLAAAEVLPKRSTKPGGCMLLCAASEDATAAIMAALRRGRLDILEQLRGRLRAAVADKELPRATDVERWSRFYLSVIQGMALQAHDGATSAELELVVKSAIGAWPG